MTKQERTNYLVARGWSVSYVLYPATSRVWRHATCLERHTFLGAFMRQQAIDARREREAEGR